jgi:hypothetical protein
MSLYLQDQNQEQYPLILPTPEICEWIEKNAPTDILPWVTRTCVASGSYGLGPLAQGVGVVQPSGIKIGVFDYPGFGASRWGYGCYLISENQLQLLIAGTYGDGTQQMSVTLKMAAEGQKSGEAIRLKCYALPPYPLGRIAKNQGNSLSSTNQGSASWYNGLYLLILVDPRYYFQWSMARTIPQISITDPTSVAWLDIINALVTDLGITVNNLDTVGVTDAYLYPDITLNLNGENAALVLDGVLANLGYRLVANYDSTFLINEFVDAQTIVGNDWDNAFTIGRSMRSGGQDDVDDFSSLVPKQLIMRNQTRLCAGFPTSSSYPSFVFTTVQVTGNINYANLEGAVGFTSGSLAIRDTCLALLSGPSNIVPTNLASITALAQQLFDDWCQWRVLAYDITWNGVANIVPSGLEDRIIFTYRHDDCTTREMTAPLTGLEGGEMNHQDMTALEGCQDSAGTAQFTDGSPGFLYLTPDGTSVMNGLLIDGRIQSEYVGPAPT